MTATGAHRRHITCPKCGAHLNISADTTASTFRCHTCGEVSPMPTGIPPPGWYADPDDKYGERWWDGTAWTKKAIASTDASGISRQAAVAIGVCLLVGIGLVMSMQPVSLMSGSGSVWTGVAVVTVGAAGAFVLRAAVWVRVVAVIVLVLALINAVSIEVEMSHKRDELTHIFDR